MDWVDYIRPKNTPHYSDKGGHCKRSLANDPKHKEHWKKAKTHFVGLLGIAIFSLTSCEVSPETEAYTTPGGIIYTVDNPPQELIDHEECHQKRAEKEGVLFWFRYSIEPQFRCEEEIRCGQPNHFYCENK